MASGSPDSHGHRHDTATLDSEVDVSARARFVLVVTLVLVAVLTASGLVRWWPSEVLGPEPGRRHAVRRPRRDPASCYGAERVAAVR